MKPLFPQGLPFLNTTPNNYPWKIENNTLIHREKKKERDIEPVGEISKMKKEI